jgi:AhpD family alkylhydroperoxidase
MAMHGLAAETLIHRNAGQARCRYGINSKPRDLAMNNWPQLTTELSALLRNLRGAAPDVMKAFAGIAQAATVSKALDGKTKELIALGIAVAVRCDDCIAFHVKAAVEHGATKEEISETLGMAIYMGAGPSVMYASHAMEAFTQFKAGAARQPAETAAAS